mgnify:CR=1 FL=1
MKFNSISLKNFVIFAAFFFVLAAGAKAQSGLEISPAARDYLNEALDIMQKNSLLKKQVDWEDLRRKTFEKAAGAQETIDTWDAIRFALRSIGDNHSFLQLTDELAEKEKSRRKTENPSKAQTTQSRTPSPYAKRRTPEGFVHKLDGCVVGQIVVPLYLAQKGDDFATVLNKFIADTDGRNPCGWIVDLRGNGGGNIFPMLAGVGALLDEGDASYAIDADDKQTAFFYKNGQSGLREPDGKETFITKIEGEAYKVKKQLPVAVLIDGGTASSGEGIAMAFRGRKNTRFFGTHTFGVSTSNEGFRLSDGANIVLTTGVGADKNGVRYFSGIAPDEKIETGETMPPAEKDPVVLAALEWLKKQAR